MCLWWKMSAMLFAFTSTKGEQRNDDRMMPVALILFRAY